MEAYRQQLSIAEMLGDRNGISVALGSIGNLFHEQGEYDRAMQFHQRKLAIDEELGDRRGASIAVGNMGSIYSDRGEYDRALEAFARAIADHRAIGFRYGLAASLEGAADTLLAIVEAGDPMPEHLPRHLPELDEETWQRDSLRSARKWSEESLRIAGEISRPEFLFSCRVLLARLEAAEDRRDHAVKALEDLLREAESDEQRAEARYRLWKLGEQKERAAAAMLYETLYAKTPMYLYRERLAEIEEGEQEQ
jgi:tetratricopeptide (TPR) repeat protein